MGWACSSDARDKKCSITYVTSQCKYVHQSQQFYTFNK
jgi:hypothetical protein